MSALVTDTCCLSLCCLSGSLAATDAVLCRLDNLSIHLSQCADELQPVTFSFRDLSPLDPLQMISTGQARYPALHWGLASPRGNDFTPSVWATLAQTAHLLPVPANSLQGGMEMIVESGIKFRFHASRLRKASRLLGSFLDDMHASHPQGSKAKSQTELMRLFMPTVTVPQAYALLQAVYSPNVMSWVHYQSLAMVQNLANVAHMLQCKQLLSIADEDLAARAVLSRPSPDRSLQTLQRVALERQLPPHSLLVMMCWAGSLGMIELACKCEETLAPRMSEISAEVLAELHPVVVKRYLADLRAQLTGCMASAQDLLSRGHHHDAEIMLTKARALLQNLPF